MKFNLMAQTAVKKERLDGGELSLSHASQGKEPSLWTWQPNPVY